MTGQELIPKLRKAKGLWFRRQGMNDMAVINTTRPTCRLVRINPREGDDTGLTDKAVQPVVIQVDADKSLLLVKGAVPGKSGSLLRIRGM